MCRYFLNISSTFEQYRDNTDNRDHFGHYNRDDTVTSLVCVCVCVCICLINSRQNSLLHDEV